MPPKYIESLAEDLKNSFENIFHEDNDSHATYAAQCAILHIDRLLNMSFHLEYKMELKEQKQYLLNKYILRN